MGCGLYTRHGTAPHSSSWGDKNSESKLAPTSSLLIMNMVSLFSLFNLSFPHPKVGVIQSRTTAASATVKCEASWRSCRERMRMLPQPLADVSPRLAYIHSAASKGYFIDSTSFASCKKNFNASSCICGGLLLWISTSGQWTTKLVRCRDYQWHLIPSLNIFNLCEVTRTFGIRPSFYLYFLFSCQQFSPLFSEFSSDATQPRTRIYRIS